MSLVKQREATVDPQHLTGRPLALALPITWVRDHLKAGDRVSLWIDSEDQSQFIIKVNPPENGLK